MSLKLLQPGLQPLGQFDGLDSDVLTLKGGEVVSFASVTTNAQPGVTTSGLDQAAYDVFDGYVNQSGTLKRPAVTRLFNTNGSTGLPVVTSRPLMLSDEGITGYGTLFGSVVGGTIGQQVNGPTTFTGAVLGPSTATGSGKVTCWHLAGLYAVSLDNTDGYLQPTNTALTVGAPLSFTNMGLLTPLGNNQLSNAPVVAHLVEFNSNQSLVTTPNFLVAALNSPSGNVSSVGPRVFQFATIYFAPPGFSAPAITG
jgi:hypothetical protein